MQQIENGTYVKKKKEERDRRGGKSNEAHPDREMKTIGSKFVNGVLYVKKKNIQ